MAENKPYALDWDDEIEREGGTFTVLPSGIYPFRIGDRILRERYEGSAKLPACPQAVIEVTFDGGSLGKTTIEEKLKLVSNLEFVLTSFFTSIGARKHGERMKMDWGKVPNATGVARLEVYSWDKKDGSGKGYGNRVAEWLEPGTAIDHPKEPWQRPEDSAPAADSKPAWAAGDF